MALRRTLQLISWLALAGTILPSLLYLAGRADLPFMKWLMLLAAIAWFAITPLWMGRPSAAADGS